MKDWIVRGLPSGTELHSYHGVRPGDVVDVLGWTGKHSVDTRKVVALHREVCAGSVMVTLDQPLHNGSRRVAIGWLRGHK